MYCYYYSIYSIYSLQIISGGKGQAPPQPPSDKKTQELRKGVSNVQNHTPIHDDIALEASKKNATEWWKRGVRVESGAKPANQGNMQTYAPGSTSTPRFRLPSTQQERTQDSTAEVDYISNTNLHEPGD